MTAIGQGVYPPAEDAPERDWAAFADALVKIMEALAELLLRLFEAFPAARLARS